MTECNYAYRFADIHSCVFLRTGFFGVLLFSGSKDYLPEKHKENRQDVVTHYDWNRLRMSDMSSTRNFYAACPVESELDTAK